MKILYHHRTASRDGQAVHIEEMIGALRALGHEVRVVAPEAGAAEGDAMGAKVGWVHGLRDRLPKALYELLELGYSFVAYRRLMAAAREFKPEVLYERCNLFLISGVLVHRRLGLPMLLEVNAPLTDERARFGGLGLPRLARWSERFAWRGADRVLPVTRALGDIVVAGGVADEKIVVIPNGINESHFAHAPAPDEARRRLALGGGLVLGFTGFVRDWHGVDRVLRWMATPQAPKDCMLLVVGDGPARAGLEQLARELGLEQRLRFTGFVSRDAVPSHVAAFDIALQPAVTSYASPLKLFEYLALGKAIVAPRLPNIQEVLNDGANALLFRDGAGDQDDDSLARALTRLSADVALRDRLGAGAKATISDKGLTWQHNATRVGALFAELLGSRPASTGQAKAGVSDSAGAGRA